MQIGNAIDDWHLTLTGATSARSIPCVDHRVIAAALTGQMGGKPASHQPPKKPAARNQS
jgi:hypothetical protein